MSNWSQITSSKSITMARTTKYVTSSCFPLTIKTIALHWIGYNIVTCSILNQNILNIVGYVFTRRCDHVEDFLSENQPFLGPVYMKVGDPVFSLNFSSEGMGRFMAGKAQDMWQRRTFLGGGRIVEWGTWLGPCCEILELSSLKRHSLYFKQTGHCFL